MPPADAMGHGELARDRASEAILELCDPRVADYVNIREADLLKHRGVFIAEGAEVIRTMISRSRLRPRSLFLSEKRRGTMRDVIEALPPDVPVFWAPQALMDQVVGFPIHRGCLAAGVRPSERAWTSVLDVLDLDDGPGCWDGERPETWSGGGDDREGAERGRPRGRGRTILVLEALSNHDNVGALFRNAAALGAGAVLLDPRSADPLYRKAIRVSMGATLTVPFARMTPWPESLRDLAARGFVLAALTPAREAVDVARLLHGEEQVPDDLALLLGAEGSGLSTEALRAAHVRWRIPMVEGLDSINVATSAAIALWLVREMRRRAEP